MVILHKAKFTPAYMTLPLETKTKAARTADPTKPAGFLCGRRHFNSVCITSNPTSTPFPCFEQYFVLPYHHHTWTMGTKFAQTWSAQGTLQEVSVLEMVCCSLTESRNLSFQCQVQPFLCTAPLLTSVTIAQEYFGVQLGPISDLPL